MDCDKYAKYIFLMFTNLSIFIILTMLNMLSKLNICILFTTLNIFIMFSKLNIFIIFSGLYEYMFIMFSKLNICILFTTLNIFIMISKFNIFIMFTGLLFRFWRKKSCLYRVRQAEEPWLPHLPGTDVRMQLSSSTWKTRRHWVQQDLDYEYISLYRAGWQNWRCVAYRVSAAKEFAQLGGNSHTMVWCLVQLGAVCSLRFTEQ